MSRFPHFVEETLDDLVRRRAPDIESLACRIAAGIRERQGASRSECRIRAKVPHTRHAPLSGLRTQDVFTLLGWAAASARGVCSLVGVETVGMTACPCAQDMLRDHARTRLIEAGFTNEQMQVVFDSVPLATHSQRGRGTLLVSDHPGVSADDLLRIVEASMSSEVYGLLKRPDEFFVVNKAHRNPKFVEDVVRDMLGFVVEMYADLPDDGFALASQVNFESIHPHDVTAERGALLGQLRREAAGGPPGPSIGVREWFERSIGGP
jgi:GTP cyclohydrolase-4